MNQDGEKEGDDITLAGEYALHLMDAADRRAFEARLDREPALRMLVRDWDERLAPMTDDVAPIRPPARVKRQIEQELFTLTPASAQQKHPIRFLSFGRIAAATLIMGGIVISGVFLFAPSPDTHQVRLTATDQSLLVTARYKSETRTLKVTRQAGIARPGRTLELWLIADGLEQPVSLGLLSTGPATSISINAALAPKMATATLAVSDEPAGGSPTGLPTGRILITGAVTKL